MLQARGAAHLSPYRGDEAESGEEDQHRPADLADQAGKHVAADSGGANSACKTGKSSAHPRGIGPFRRQERPVCGEYGPTVEIVRDRSAALLDCLGASADVARLALQLFVGAAIVHGSNSRASPIGVKRIAIISLT